MDRRCQRVDPVVLGSLATTRLLWWREEEKTSDTLGQRVMDERYAQGCRIGVSLSMRGIGGQFSILSLWSDEIEAFRAGMEQRFSLVHTYAAYLHEAAFRHAGDGEAAHNLTDIELELLKWTAVGKTAWEISVLVSLPERTVHYHLAEASRKVGAPNKTAAVCTALRAGLLVPDD